MEWSTCSKTCGFGGHQTRRRDCSIESQSSQHGFLTSNIPLEQYLIMYAKCEGIRSENRKCSVQVCKLAGDKSVSPSSSDGSATVSKPAENSSKWTDWVSGLIMFKKVTENVPYIISVKATGKFVNINWNNHLRNPTSPTFQRDAESIEAALDNVMMRYEGYKYAKIIQFASDESTLKARSGTMASMTFGAYVRFIMVIIKSIRIYLDHYLRYFTVKIGVVMTHKCNRKLSLF